jgi:predicted lysophospholipase L1 biosynthesis ABC-type transport system permease subunit
MYLSFAQFPSRFMSVAIRTGEAAPEVLEAARRVLAEVDPRLVPLAPASLAQRFADSVAPERATVCLVGGIGLAALLLAAVGLYGVVSYGTRRRVREIGIRMALGARTGDVLSLVLREGLVPVLAGAVAGSAGAFAAARLLRGSFYGLEGLDPLVLTANVGLLAAAALAALWQPARRAARTDPARVLSA